MIAWGVRGCRLLALALTAVAAIASVRGAAGDDGVVVGLDKYPFVLYVATPYTVCFGALLTERLVVTDARCLHPFSNGDGAPELVKGTLGPEFLMVGLPTPAISAALHNIYLSMQGFAGKISLADAQARTFFGLVGTYVDNSTFYAVDQSAVHAYYPQSEYVESAALNFDVGILALTHPIKNVRTMQLQLDDLETSPAITVLSFPPSLASDDAAKLSVLYKGVDLTTVQKTDVSPLSRSSCNSDYTNAYGLKDMSSFAGHTLPDKNAPIYCAPIYGNVTQCTEDTGIKISSSAPGANSTTLSSTLVLLTSGGTTRVASFGSPRLFEARSDPAPPCSSNGFVQFARTGIYADWIGWATNGSIAPNGSWTNKKLTGDLIADFVRPGTAATLHTAHGALLAAAASMLAAFAVAL